VPLVLLASGVRAWRRGLLVVQPERLLRRHRACLRLFRRWRSTPRSRSPRVPQRTVDLIQRGYVSKYRPEPLTEYRPNPSYLYESSDFDVDAAAKVLVNCLARWATDYEFWPVGFPEDARRGSLPTDRAARDALLETLWQWLHDWWTSRPEYEGLLLNGVYLRRGSELLFDQHDAFSDGTRVFLTGAQVRQLRDCLVQHGLPVDFLKQALTTER
jgi:hypothetical protein